MQIRLKFIAGLFLLALVAIVFRLFYWQIIRGRVLSSQAKGQYETDTALSAFRGNILASDGTWLAARSEVYLVYAEIPQLKDSPKAIAEKLAPFFVEEVEDKSQVLIEIDRLYSLLTKKEVVWIPLKQRVPPETKKNIEAMGIAGIGFERGEARPQFNDNLFKTVDELELSVRSANCLKNADIKYIGEMVQKSEQEMLRTKNFGRKSLNEIKEILKGMGLDFGMKLDGFPSRKDLDATHSEQKETA